MIIAKGKRVYGVFGEKFNPASAENIMRLAV
jgi:hypothetical protein